MICFQISYYDKQDGEGEKKLLYLNVFFFHLKSIQGVKNPVFMAPPVTFLAPSPVKKAHVTYKVEHVWSVKLVCMAITVIKCVPQTVRTTDVVHRMEHVLHVNLDGLEHTVKQVITFVSIPGFLVYFFIYQ